MRNPTVLLMWKGAVFRAPARRIPSSPLRFCRFKASKTGSEKDTSKELDKKANTNVGKFDVKNTTSAAAPAPMDNQTVASLMKRDKKPYIAKAKHERLTYDYPGLPNQDDFTKQSQKGNTKGITRWSRYVPKIITAVVVVWGAYTVKVWLYPSEEGADSQELLDPNFFHKFVVTHKEQMDEDHYLIELKPKFSHWQYSFYTNYSQKSLWNGDRIWSVEVKQPEIMVVRSYTPLPLYFMKSEYTRSGERKPLLKVIAPNNNDYDRGGVMCFYVKRYPDGEVSKYICDRKVGDEIEIRGPNIEYKFPYHPLKKFHERPVFRDLPSKIEPETYVEKIMANNKIPEYDNLTFYAGGTGIAPILQVLMSRNPYRGFVTVHYSARKPGELASFERFMFFLEKLDRVKFINHYDSQRRSALKESDVMKPEPSNFLSPMRQEEKIQNLNDMSPEEALKLRQSILDDDNAKEVTAQENDVIVPQYENAIEQAQVTSKRPKKPSSLALVCGPDGYVEYVAGRLAKATNEQGPVEGILGKKGWDNTNTYKLSN